MMIANHTANYLSSPADGVFAPYSPAAPPEQVLGWSRRRRHQARARRFRNRRRLRRMGTYVRPQYEGIRSRRGLVSQPEHPATSRTHSPFAEYQQA
jgi:hypothetical protein